jgi:hypothetical protein
MRKEDINKLNKSFVICKWLFILVAILTLISITYCLVTGTVSMVGYVAKSIEVIIYSLVLALIFSRTTVDTKEK